MAGKLTRAQADARLARGERLIDRIVNARLAAPKSKAGLLNPAAQAQTRLDRLSARLDRLINRTR
jgi:hypothetical protein